MYELKLPELGEGITSGEIVRILVAVGEVIAADQTVLELSTDKATVEVPSPQAGRVVSIQVSEGQKAQVGTALLVLDTEVSAQTTDSALAAPLAVTAAALTPMKLPELGEGVTTCTLLRLAVTPGDTVLEGQLVAEVETDKASMEIPASQAGVVAELIAQPGDTLKPGATLLVLRAEVAVAPVAVAPVASAPVAPAPVAPAPVAAPVAPAPAVPGRTMAAAPSVRQFARELGVDLAQVEGSGPGGRISQEDVKAYIRTAPRGGSPAPAPALPDFERFGPITREKLSGLRKAAARQMALCWSTIPHVTLHLSADVTEVEALRQRYKLRAEKLGFKLTLTPILLKVVAAALKTHPILNASLDLEREEVLLKRHYHLGVATDTPRGLVVPVVRDVDRKNILELAQELAGLSEKARLGKLSPEEMAGATFSLTNLGGLGIGAFTPIVNFPQVGILGVGKTETVPTYVDGVLVPREKLPLSLSFDHRLVDGADGARFLEWVKQALESPLLLAMEG